jgi:hypothetical protein
MAVNSLESATSIGSIAKAAEVLSSLNKVSESTRISSCKKVAKLLVTELSTLPSFVYKKAQIYRFFNCETLSGVTTEIDNILGLKAEVEQLPTDELYFAYLLYVNAGVYGAKNPPSEKLNDLLADRAVKDWLKNFKPDKWTLKKKITETVVVGGVEETVEKVEVEELDVKMLQMTEMLASLMTRPAMKQEIETKLGTAFNILVREAYPESGRFFLSKKDND